MKIECTPKEIADFVTELQSRLLKNTDIRRLYIQELRKIADYYGFSEDEELNAKLLEKEKELNIV